MGNRLYLLLIGICWTGVLFAQTPELVFDANKKAERTSIGAPYYFNDSLFYFYATSQAHGRGIWISNGTEEGVRYLEEIHDALDGNEADFYPFGQHQLLGIKTTVIRDNLWFLNESARKAFPIKTAGGSVFSSLSKVSCLNDTAYFIAKPADSSTYSLWYLVKGDSVAHIFYYGSQIPQSRWSQPYPVNGKVIFEDFNTQSGSEWWVTDGTDQGTFLLKDIEIGSNSANIGNVTILKNKILFTAINSTDGFELWETDGTTSGTRITKQNNPGPNSSLAGVHGTFRDRMVFSLWSAQGERELYEVLDNGTINALLKLGVNKNYFIQSCQFNNNLYLIWSTTGTNNELYLGNSGGFQAISLSFIPTDHTLSKAVLTPNSVIYSTNKSFAATNINTPNSPVWYYDSNGNKDTTNGFWIGHYQTIGDSIYTINYAENKNYIITRFYADSSQVYINQNDEFIKETQSAGYLQTFITPKGIYFAFRDDSLNIFFTHGSTNTTRQIARLPLSSNLYQFDSSSVVVLLQKDSSEIFQLNPNGLAPEPLFSLPGPYTIASLYKLGEHVYFIMRYSIFMHDFYSWHPLNGLTHIYDFDPGEDDDAELVGVWNNKVILYVKENELWISDGTNTGTSKFASYDATFGSPLQHVSTSAFGIYYFKQYNSLQKITETLYFYDPVNQSHTNIKSYSACCFKNGEKMRYTQLHRDSLYFIGSESVYHPTNVFVSNGTIAGTKVLFDQNGDTLFGEAIIGMFDQTLFLSVNNGNLPRTAMIAYNLLTREITPIGDSLPAEFNGLWVQDIKPNTTYHDGSLYFAASTYDKPVLDLWKSDGTIGGTKRISNFVNGTGFGFGITFFGKKADTLYFGAFNAPIGYELWNVHLGCAAANIGMIPPCLGEELEISAQLKEYDTPFQSLKWILNGNEISTAIDFKVTFSDTSIQHLKLTANAGSACNLTDERWFSPIKRTSSSLELISDSLCLTGNQFVGMVTDSNKNKTFSWNWGDGKNGTGWVDSNSFLLFGSYTLEIKSSVSGACPDSFTKLITVLPSPSIPQVFGPDSSTLVRDTFHVNLESNLSYIWTVVNGNLENINGDTFAIIEWLMRPGTGIVQLITENQYKCQSIPVQRNIHLAHPTSLALIENKSELFPNPSMDRITIRSEGNPIRVLGLFDVAGKGNYLPLITTTSDSIELDIRSLPNGVYLILLEINGFPVQRKFVKN